MKKLKKDDRFYKLFPKPIPPTPAADDKGDGVTRFNEGNTHYPLERLVGADEGFPPEFKHYAGWSGGQWGFPPSDEDLMAFLMAIAHQRNQKKQLGGNEEFLRKQELLKKTGWK